MSYYSHIQIYKNVVYISPHLTIQIKNGCKIFIYGDGEWRSIGVIYIYIYMKITILHLWRFMFTSPYLFIFKNVNIKLLVFRGIEHT